MFSSLFVANTVANNNPRKPPSELKVERDSEKASLKVDVRDAQHHDVGLHLQKAL